MSAAESFARDIRESLEAARGERERAAASVARIEAGVKRGEYEPEFWRDALEDAGLWLEWAGQTVAYLERQLEFAEAGESAEGYVWCRACGPASRLFVWPDGDSEGEAVDMIVSGVAGCRKSAHAAIGGPPETQVVFYPGA